MTRTQLLDLRDKTVEALSCLAYPIIRGAPTIPGAAGGIELLSIIHGAVVNQLRSDYEQGFVLEAIELLDDALGQLINMEQGTMSGEEAVDILRPLLTSALAYLERYPEAKDQSPS